MSDSPSSPWRIAVIGGGLAGLAAAHRLLECGRAAQLRLDISVFETQSRTGGLIGTVEQDGYLIDTGADSFITNKPRILPLCERLGLQSRLQTTDPKYRGALLLHRGLPVPVPDGFQLLSPTKLRAVMTTPVLSLRGKLRLASEVFIPARKDGCDESLADFARRRFGTEAFERIIQPLVAGIYTSDSEQLSIRATLPRFPEMEQKYGSLIRAARLQRRSRAQDDSSSSGARYGMFLGLRGGMGEFVQALSTALAPSVRMHWNTPVVAIRPGSETKRDVRGYSVETSLGSIVQADAVIVALPLYRTATLIRSWHGELSDVLDRIDYASSAIVMTGHALSDFTHPLDSFGLVIPQCERRKILAVSFSSRKFPNRAPAGKILLRTFVGGALQADLLDRNDAEITDMVLSELRHIFGMTGRPDLTIVKRYPRAMPQYTLGHLDRVRRIERLVESIPRLELAGNAFHGVGIPDAVASGEMAAERIIAALSSDGT